MSTPSLAFITRLPWPLPAVLAWAAAWLVWLLLRKAGLDAAAAVAGGLATSLLLALGCSGRWRRGIAAAGFPLSALALGAAGALPAWLWLLLLLPVLAAYPLRAWRDAPFFPTPADALESLPNVITTAPLSVLDAGCGLGHGLDALHALWPQAQAHGLEWSAPLAWLAALRCRRFAHIRRGDMWAACWAGHDIVYVFQRPESMRRVFDKAQRELAPGAWLVSLEFAVPGQAPQARLRCRDGRDLWLYQMPQGGPSLSAARSTTAGRGR